MRVDQANIALVPDAMGAADDVIDDVGIDVVEPLHRLNALATLGHQIDEIAALDRGAASPDALPRGLFPSAPLSSAAMLEFSNVCHTTLAVLHTNATTL